MVCRQHSPGGFAYQCTPALTSCRVRPNDGARSRRVEKVAAKSNYPEYGISGRLNYITEKGIKQIGLSGNKAQHADLTVELGFSSDLGVTNDRYPHEVCEGQSQMMGFSNATGFRYPLKTWKM